MQALKVSGHVAAALMFGNLSFAQDREFVWLTELELVAGAQASQGQAIAPVDAANGGGTWVAGSVVDASGARDICFARLDSAGNQGVGASLDTGSFGGGSRADVCSDDAGGFFLCGEADSGSSFATPGLGSNDGVLARFDASGAELWARRIGGEGNDGATALAPNGAGGVVVVGRTSGGMFGGPPAAGFGSDAFIANYDGDGNEIWVRRISGFTDHSEFLTSVTSDGAGGWFAAGFDSDFYGDNYGALARINAAGDLLFYDGRIGLFSTYLEVVSDGQDGAFAAGQTTDSQGNSSGLVSRFAGTGDLLWSREIGDFFESAGLSSIDRDETGSAVTVGAQGSSLLIARYEPDGTLSGSDLLTPGSGFWSGNGLSLDLPGSALVAGSRSGAAWGARIALSQLGTNIICDAQPNSTGVPATLQATGSSLVSDNFVTLYANDLPLNRPGIFAVSRLTGSFPMAGGSQGTLCLRGGIGRLRGPGGAFNSGPFGNFHLQIDLDNIPQPGGAVMVLPGQSWFFQAWHRDTNPGSTSNFTTAVEVVLN